MKSKLVVVHLCERCQKAKAIRLTDLWLLFPRCCWSCGWYDFDVVKRRAEVTP